MDGKECRDNLLLGEMNCENFADVGNKKIQ